MSKQTAVEWFLEIIKRPVSKDEIDEIIQKALEMEKEQIIKAYDESNKLLCLKCTDFKTGIKYYNETFKKEKK